MWTKVAQRLLTIKSIVTLIMTMVFAYLAVTGNIPADKFQDLFYIVIAFYFGSSLEKTAKATGSETE